jgi:hypothetical protein
MDIVIASWHDMRWFMLICLSITCLGVSCTKKFDAVANKNVENEIIYFEVDKLGRLYTITSDQKVISYTENKVKLFEYFDSRLGNISSIDASNPLSIMIYFKEQGVIKLLDNTLSEIKRINLYQDGKFNFISSVCRANDNNYWIYEEQLQRFFKIDANLNIIRESNFLKDMGLDKFRPFFLKERGNTLIAANENKAVVFDNYGQYIKSFDLDKFDAIDFDGDNIYHLNRNTLTKQNVKQPAISTYLIENKMKIQQIRIDNGKVYGNIGNEIINILY